MTKDRIADVLRIINESDAMLLYRNELETTLAVILDYVTEEQIEKVYAEMREDSAYTNLK